MPVMRERMAEAGFRFKDDETHTTAQVAEMLGVAQSTLRRWERVGKIPKVQRDSAGRRVYRQEDWGALDYQVTRITAPVSSVPTDSSLRGRCPGTSWLACEGV